MAVVTRPLCPSDNDDIILFAIRPPQPKWAAYPGFEDLIAVFRSSPTPSNSGRPWLTTQQARQSKLFIKLQGFIFKVQQPTEQRQATRQVVERLLKGKEDSVLSVLVREMSTNLKQGNLDWTNKLEIPERHWNAYAGGLLSERQIPEKDAINPE